MVMNHTVCIILVILGAILILAGLAITVIDSLRRPVGDRASAHAESVSESIKALTELLKTIRDTPPGQWLIVLGVVVLFIAATFCGIEGVTTGNHV